jgi:hypothetical protein
MTTHHLLVAAIVADRQREAANAARLRQLRGPSPSLLSRFLAGPAAPGGLKRGARVDRPGAARQARTSA